MSMGGIKYKTVEISEEELGKLKDKATKFDNLVKKVKAISKKLSRELRDPSHDEECGDGACCCTCDEHDNLLGQYTSELKAITKEG